MCGFISVILCSGFFVGETEEYLVLGIVLIFVMLIQLLGGTQVIASLEDLDLAVSCGPEPCGCVGLEEFCYRGCVEDSGMRLGVMLLEMQ